MMDLYEQFNEEFFFNDVRESDEDELEITMSDNTKTYNKGLVYLNEMIERFKKDYKREVNN